VRNTEPLEELARSARNVLGDGEVRKEVVGGPLRDESDPVAPVAAHGG
jgi:hypothetical protein